MREPACIVESYHCIVCSVEIIRPTSIACGFKVSVRTLAKWRALYRTEAEAGFLDRPGAAKEMPDRPPQPWAS